MFRRARFGGVIQTQLDLFVRDHRDVLDDVDERLRAYNSTNRDQAEELYGDYVDAVETGTEILADVRDRRAEHEPRLLRAGRVVERGFDGRRQALREVGQEISGLGGCRRRGR